MERELYTLSMTSETALERQQRIAYLRDFVPSVIGYAVVLAIGLSFVGDEVDSTGEWILVILPVIPALWGVRAVMRNLRGVDEYQRLVQLEAMAVGFGVSMVVAITVGFVGVAGTATVAAGWIVYSAGMLAWAIVVQVRSRR
jgi:hypothetical protein